MDADDRAIRALSLDGGGVRGISELLVLKELMKNVNRTRKSREKLEPWQLFDVIAGTGTGGLIAILLGRLHMSVDESIHVFLQYSEAIFKPRRAKWNVFSGETQSRSKHDQEILYNIISKSRHSRASPRDLMYDSDSACKVFVVGTKTESRTDLLLRSYRSPYSGEQDLNLTVWEAAHATIASSVFFEPLMLHEVEFGDTRDQNPVNHVYREVRDLWSENYIVLVSIGAGSAPENKFTGRMRRNIEEVARISDNAEATAQRFERGLNYRGPESPTSYYRFNVLQSVDDIDLAEYTVLPRMKSITQEHFERHDVRTDLHRCVDELSEINFEVKPPKTQSLERQQAQDDEFQKLADWISPVDMSVKQSDVIAKLQIGTGSSLIPTRTFQSWFRGRTRTLICTGAPGVGKTVLASQAIDHLLKDQSHNPVLYFFADMRTQLAEEQSPATILAVLLKQLILHNRSVSDWIQWLSKRHIRGGSRPDVQELLECFKHEIVRSNAFFVVIDALDELPQSFLPGLLRCIRELQEICHVSFMATSRPVSWLSDILDKTFERYQTLEIAPTQDDMEAYLLGQMSSLPDIVMRRTDMQEYIKDRIMEISQGRFLVAKLLLDYITPLVTVRQIKSALSLLPHELHGIYGAILVRITEQDYFSRYLAFRVFRWLGHVQRPITAQELRHAFAVEANEGYHDDDNMIDTEVLTSACGGLVVVTANTDIVTFVHITAEEYFKRDIFEGNFSTSHADIAMTCLRYLSFERFAKSANLGNYDLQLLMNEYPFLDYAARFWGVHVRETPVQDDEAIIDEALNLLSTDRLVSCCSQIMLLPRDRTLRSSQMSSKGVTGLHLVAYFGLLKVAKSMLQKYPELAVNAQDSNGRTAASWAVERNQIEMVRFFISSRTYIDLKDHQGVSNLEIAAMNGNEEMIQELLALGADLSVPKRPSQTAASFAAMYGHLGSLKIVVEKLPDMLDFRDNLDRTPLYLAAENGHVETVVYLVNQTAVNVNARDKGGQTPLTIAARRGQIGVVVVLLAHEDTQFDVQDQTGRTALMWAVIEGQLDVLKELLAHGDAKEALELRDYSGRTALAWATIEDHKPIRELLESRKDGDLET